MQPARHIYRYTYKNKGANWILDIELYRSGVKHLAWGPNPGHQRVQWGHKLLQIFIEIYSSFLLVMLASQHILFLELDKLFKS